MKWIDMHCDTLSEIVKRKGKDFSGKNSLKHSKLCVDIDRLIQEESVTQFFACYVNVREYRWDWNRAYQAVLEMIDEARAEEGDCFEIADDAMKIGHEKKTLTGILTVEEGGVLGGDLKRLDELCERGIRLLTLTWNYVNCIGSPNSRDTKVMERGLTDFGRDVVERMNELGMIVDVSHLSDGGFWDCIRYSKSPVTASHSNARSLCNHPRNLSDEMLHALGEKGGVAGLNFYSVFLKGNGRATADDIAAHAKWMINRAGEDAVALGTDFDGFEPDFLPAGISGVQDIERIWEGMRRNGITSRQAEKIAYKNVMRLIREVRRL